MDTQQSIAPFSTKKLSLTVETVQGPVLPREMGIIDGHNHVWIERIPGTELDLPVLDNFQMISKEL